MTTGTPMTNSSIPSFDDLPDSAFIRASHLVRDTKHPNRPVPLQISMSTLWRYCAAGGTFPKPVKLSSGITAWRVGEVRAWLNNRAAAPIALAA
jgi:predicted DNA-binding transcriptional regulator AlpA